MGFKEAESAMYRFEQSLMKEPDDFYLYKDDLLGWIEIFKRANQKQLPVIPEFVSDFIKERTEDKYGDKPEDNSVYNFIDNCLHDFQLGYYPEIKNWYHTSLDNQIRFELAWLEGCCTKNEENMQ